MRSDGALCQKHLGAVIDHIDRLEFRCLGFGLTPAYLEICRLKADLNNHDQRDTDLKQSVATLHSLVEDHLSSCVIFCVSDQEQLESFFELQLNRWTEKMIMVRKDPAKVFGASIIAAFPSTAADLKEATSCLIFDRHTAGVFHLMRAVEVGALRVARLAGMEEALPSWWAVIGHLEITVCAASVVSKK